MRLGSTLSHATPATPAESPKQVSSAVVQGPCGHQHPDPRAGFTLLELSIVLLTAGLLIFFGLMHLSEMRRLTTRNPLQCQQNLIVPLGGDNQAAGLEEQCAGLDLRFSLPVVVGE